MIKIIMSMSLLFSINIFASSAHDHSHHDHSHHGHSHQGTKEDTEKKINAYAQSCEDGNIKAVIT